MARPKPKRGRNKPDLADRGLQREGKVLELLAARPPAVGWPLMAVYLTGAYWPWWIAIFLLLFVIWIFVPAFDPLLYAVFAFGILAVLGYGLKRLIERVVLRE